MGIDAIVALSLAAEGALDLVQSALHPAEPYPLPPHDDPRGITRYRDEVLDPLRKIGDKHTDDLIEAIALTDPAPAQAQSSGTGSPAGGSNNPQAGQAAEEPQNPAVRDFYKLLLDKRKFEIGDFGAKAYKGDLDNWVNAIPTPPASYVPRLQRAGKFFHDNLVKIMVILSTSSLLEAFASEKGVRVLSSTKRFSDNPSRRLYESLQFVLYANEPDGFTKTGNAVNAILRVRLMHGCIRWTLRNEAKWRSDLFGVPINGEDLLGMQMGFSGLIIRDLPKLWKKVTLEEAEDHIFLWNVVGQLLGAPMQWRAANIGEALALIMAVERRQQGPSDRGRLMTDRLLDFHRARLGRFYPVGLYLMHRLAGEHICKMLEVPLSPMASVIRSIPGTVINDALKLWGMRLVFGGAAVDRPPYDIPPSLEDVYQQYVTAQTRHP